MRPLVVIAVLSAAASALPWPVLPQDAVHPIGISYGNFQIIGGRPFLHDGVDILAPASSPVVAIKSGYVKWVPKGEQYKYAYGVVVADSAGAGFCSGFRYLHLVETIQVHEGETVEVGDTLGWIIQWPDSGYSHIHFQAVCGSGAVWEENSWQCCRNPLLDLSPDSDPTGPRFLDALDGQRFAICLDNTSTYQSADSVHGTVDLICRLDDKINAPVWHVGVYRIDYSIRDEYGAYVVPLTRGVEMSDTIPFDTEVRCPLTKVVYKCDDTCNSRPQYGEAWAAGDTGRYLYIFTNTDGDSFMEISDSTGNWNTTAWPDGDYWVKVIAWDEYGNEATDSMKVTVRNHDVGVASIASPPAVVRMDTVVTPVCTLYNHGNCSESYNVRMFIARDYQQSHGTYNAIVEVVGHAPGTKRELVFPDWTVSYVPGFYVVNCSTQLGTDITSANDRVRCSVEVSNPYIPSPCRTGVRASHPGSLPWHAWPNPARREVRFQVPFDTDVAAGELRIFDAAGRRVRTLRAVQSGGSSTLVWDGRDMNGRMLPGGVYYCFASWQHDVIRVVLLR